MQLIHIVRPVAPLAGAQPADVLRSFVFNHNLAAQESTGDRLASVSVERVLTRLVGSSESQAALLALVDTMLTPVLGPVGPLGLPEIASTDDERDLEIAAFAYLSLPLKEERRVAEVELVMDVAYLPLPGHPLGPDARAVRDELLAGVEKVCRALGRDVVQLWIEADGPEGYFCAVRVDQYVLGSPIADTGLFLGYSCRVAHNYEPLSGVATLLSHASADADHGALFTEPVEWNAARMREAGDRLRDRGERQLLVLLVDESGTATALCEFTSHLGADSTVAELGVISVTRDQRGKGLGHAVLAAGFTHLAQEWPQVKSVYVSVASSDVASAALLSRYRPRHLSSTYAWQRVLD